MSKFVDHLVSDRYVIWNEYIAISVMDWSDETNCAVLDIADKIYFCGILGILIIKRKLNKGLILLMEK